MEKLFIVIIMSISLFFISISLIVSADMQKPVLTEGDFWIYDIELFYEDSDIIKTGERKIEVHSNKIITINGSKYNSRIVTDYSIVISNFSNNTVNLSSYVIKYYTEDDISLMIYIKNDAIYGYSEIVYEYPFVGFCWPIRSGFSWERIAIRTYSNYTDSKTEEITFYYECLGKTNISTSAGFFTCYIIKIRSAEDESYYTISYRSPGTGYFEVKSEEYHNDFLTKKTELKSYKYTTEIFIEEENGEYYDSNDTKNNNILNNENKSPGFEIIILLLSLISIIILKKKKQ
jgi:hypothetical protein